ncbi:trehalose-6-phosphate synthase [Acinetobacter sp. RF15A]|uniref:alpha,alpha-trehalose-phosphate synthase (UDP-forming) n=1 Tax=unclassified Acinetobacter TaxID=196816 RepID=UPI001191EE21|nr:MULTISPECIES: trehalose-6-phosphate synthase [unclassified Acinetobacter]TSH78080.1 trehalose-6-phosphate synthase [Acinetobacter sp. RF15A]TSI20069.1 trehalose-6-phosphate synthase [Acinetobacter sp. RF15B]
MSKLIVLSNRVNLPNPDNMKAGGLAVALQDALQDIGGIWAGWNGSRTEQVKEQKFQIQKFQNVEYHTSPLTESQYQGFYCGFANNALWPLMHDQHQLVDYQPQDFKIYKEVNLRFAKHLKQIASPHDIIWIHDYHFLSVAHYCRKLGMRNRIGFFLHIPFPELKLWQTLPPHRDLAHHLANYDVLGFQTPRDQMNCIHFLEQMLHLGHRNDEILNYQSRRINVKCYPIGVHPVQIQKQAAASQQTELPFHLTETQSYKTIISVDRIDYSKGLLEKIGALQSLLEDQPEFKGQFQQLQIACPCRLDVKTYQNLYQQFQSAVEQLNQQHGSADWLPFECSFNTLGHESLMHLYRHADICWVNSIRDGMNLVAKEYIAAQDPKDPGVLILSKYAGAAEQMKEALLVDPYDHDSMNKALKKALRMSKSERIERYRYLQQGLKNFDIMRWRDQFLTDLKKAQSLRIYRPLAAGISTQFSVHG